MSGEVVKMENEKMKEEVKIQRLIGFDEEDSFAMIVEKYDPKEGTFYGTDLNLIKKRGNLYIDDTAPVGSIVAIYGFWGSRKYGIYPVLSLYTVEKSGLKEIYRFSFHSCTSEEDFEKGFEELAKVLKGKVEIIP